MKVLGFSTDVDPKVGGLKHLQSQHSDHVHLSQPSYGSNDIPSQIFPESRNPASRKARKAQDSTDSTEPKI